MPSNPHTHIHEDGAETQRLAPSIEDSDGPSGPALDQDTPPHRSTSEFGNQERLPRSLTFVNGLAIVIGIQVGSGIFTSPSAVLQNITSPASAISVWFLAGLLAWTGAASFVELGTLVPRNGGIQEYLRYCYNDLCACIATWTLVFIVKPCSIAMVSIIFAEYLLNSFGLDTSVHTLYAKAIAIAALITTSLLNCIGIRVSARIANFFLVVKLFGLASIVITGLSLGLFQRSGAIQSLETITDEHSRYNETQKNDFQPANAGKWTTAGMYTDAVLAAMWAYSGWETVRAPLRFA